ncbi:Hypothetical protein FNO222_0398 [Francisella orientalis]|uniref:PilZ domain-containing protein n=1 Tax=Francisella orientalis TaxID=299583 RepID=A0ABM5U4Q7_9GAMM|nr:hypothetical protein [Francisella orientalis]AFJ42927.1 hypothetical protein OOM_0387 [Francisella orientalis str. Toba 04]AKN85158.1 hypothetical protein FNO12_0396 [Francisella orientalis FNO12]AKN86696.1 Hypothetical protein FNO24_0396 [Francisella orientalis FNO24]AHB98030.1 hypothetical protein M973_02440 [Francisella orientalis LADL 07-285A]AKN88235.1 Hypothetical protein FNO190_0396 [Francisella orientalis]
MSRLNLLKKALSTSQKKASTKSNPRGGMLGQKPQQNSDDLYDDILLEDDFENDLVDTTADAYDTNDDIDIDDENVNIIEIDLGETKGLDIDSSLINEENENNETVDEDDINSGESAIKEDNVSSTEIVEGQIGVDYSEDDIKFEKEYLFDQREQLYNHFVKLIKNGGIEIGSSKLLYLDDIVRISVTLSELKEQVGCEARVISVFPPSISINDENTERYRYIVQFIGPNASETREYSPSIY